jgi:uncharacterized protein (TIGR02679 family)
MFERLLKNSRYSLTLPELFQVLNGEQAWTRLEQKAMIDAEWEKLIYEAIEAIDVQSLSQAAVGVLVWAEGLRDESSPGSRTLRKLFLTSRHDATICLKHGLQALLTVTQSSLFIPIRLPILAAKITGDAHALDRKYPLGRLFWWGLTFISKGQGDDGNELQQREPMLSEAYEAILEDVAQPPSLSHSILLREGYRKGGIADDDISSQVMIFAPELLGEWEERILTLRQVERLNKEQIPCRYLFNVHVVENPSVFAELVDAALSQRRQKDTCPLPVFICGNGQPTVAVIKLLDLLCGTAGTILYYAGDLDIKGLSIAQSLQMRYPHAFKDWRMNKEQYLRYHMKGIPLSEGEKNKLRYTEYTWAQDFGSIMADKGFKLHQELWVEELVSDWLNID